MLTCIHNTMFSPSKSYIVRSIKSNLMHIGEIVEHEDGGNISARIYDYDADNVLERTRMMALYRYDLMELYDTYFNNDKSCTNVARMSITRGDKQYTLLIGTTHREVSKQSASTLRELKQKHLNRS